MRSNLVIFLVSHSSRGGAQELWADLADGFKAAGHDVRLMALYPPSDSKHTSTQLQWHNVLGEKPSTLRGVIKLVDELAHIIRTERPEMVFTALPAANVIGPLAASLARIGTRVCISHHSPVSTYQRLLNFMDGFTGSLRCTSSIVAVSESVGRSLGGKPSVYKRKRLTIHNALPPHIEVKLQKLCAGRATLSRQRRVVAIGRLAEEKNYQVLVRSAMHMADIEVLIVGSGPMEHSLKKLAQSLDVSSRVHFLGQLSREEAMEVLASADVFTQPSVFEGHSLALLEAAKLGVPIVVSETAGQLEAITMADGTRCGIAVGLDDDRTLAFELQKLVDDHVYYQRWATAAAYLGEEATYMRMVSSYQSLMVI